MDLNGKNVIVTGAAQGLGFNIAAQCAKRGARVVLADIDGERALESAAGMGGLGIGADLSKHDDVVRVIDEARSFFGEPDVYCSNAAYSHAGDMLAITDDEWDLSWALNVKSHGWAAKELLPGWIERGSGCLFQTVSVVSLTLNHWDLLYAASKRAALALNEYLAVVYGGTGVQISCYCPRGMITDRLMSSAEAGSKAAVNAMRTAVTGERAGEIAVQGIEDGRFLILTEADEYASFQAKAADYEAWIAARRQQRIDEMVDG